MNGIRTVETDQKNLITLLDNLTQNMGGVPKVKDRLADTVAFVQSELCNEIAHYLVDNGHRLSILLTESGREKLNISKPSLSGAAASIALTPTNNKGFNLNLYTEVLCFDISINGEGGLRTITSSDYTDIVVDYNDPTTGHSGYVRFARIIDFVSTSLYTRSLLNHNVDPLKEQLETKPIQVNLPDNVVSLFPRK